MRAPAEAYYGDMTTDIHHTKLLTAPHQPARKHLIHALSRRFAHILHKASDFITEPA